MTSQIRPLRKADVPQAYALVKDAFPSMVLTEEHMPWRFDHPVPDVDDTRLVAVEGNTVVGYVLGRLRTDEDGTGHGRSYLGAMAEQRRGFTHAYTGNHETNKPMRTINNRIGYTLVGSESTYFKRLGP